MKKLFEDMCVMVVFDKPHMAHMVRETLRRFGFDWFILCDFKEDPLTTFQMNNVDLVVLTVAHDQSIAHRFTSFLRDNVSQGGATVPVAYVTPQPIESIEAACRELAINIVASVPVNPVSFLTSLKTSLKAKATSAMSTNYVAARRQTRSSFYRVWDKRVLYQ